MRAMNGYPARGNRTATQNLMLAGKLLSVAGVVALTSCASANSAPTSSVTTPAAASAGPNQSGEGATLTFDWRDGNSKIIEVYPGVGETQADRTYDATYNNGDTIGVVCETTGREVHDVPPEQPKGLHSDIWFKLANTVGGLPEFATAVYGDPHSPTGFQVPPC